MIPSAASSKPDQLREVVQRPDLDLDRAVEELAAAARDPRRPVQLAGAPTSSGSSSSPPIRAVAS